MRLDLCIQTIEFISEANWPNFYTVRYLMKFAWVAREKLSVKLNILHWIKSNQRVWHNMKEICTSMSFSCSVNVKSQWRAKNMKDNIKLHFVTPEIGWVQSFKMSNLVHRSNFLEPNFTRRKVRKLQPIHSFRPERALIVTLLGDLEGGSLCNSQDDLFNFDHQGQVLPELPVQWLANPGGGLPHLLYVFWWSISPLRAERRRR